MAMTVTVCLVVLATLAGSTQASTLVLSPDAAAGKDAQIANGSSSSENLGDYEHLIINWFNNDRSIGLIEFDLGCVPAGSTIDSATLSLFHVFNENQSSRYDAFRVTAAWSEATVTFDTAPSYDGMVVSTLVIPDAEISVYRDWDVTGVVQGWVAGSYPNHGFWIEEIPIQGTASAYFMSSDTDPGRRPILTIEYSPIPEPGSLVLLGLGVSGLLVYLRRRGRK